MVASNNPYVHVSPCKAKRLQTKHRHNLNNLEFHVSDIRLMHSQSEQVFGGVGVESSAARDLVVAAPWPLRCHLVSTLAHICSALAWTSCVPEELQELVLCGLGDPSVRVRLCCALCAPSTVSYGAPNVIILCLILCFIYHAAKERDPLKWKKACMCWFILLVHIVLVFVKACFV